MENEGDEMGEGRRGLDRRVFELERQVMRLVTTTAVTDVKVDGLVATMELRHKTIEGGQNTILSQLATISEEIKAIESVKAKAAGALFMIQILGVTGVIGGIVAIVRMIRG